MTQDLCDCDNGNSSGHSQPVYTVVHVKTCEGETITLKPIDNLFRCLCEKPFKTIGGLRKHASKCSLIDGVSVETSSSSSSFDDIYNESEDESEDLDPDYIVNLPSTPNIPTIDTAKMPPTTRTYDHSLIYACGGTRWTPEEQQRMISIMDAYQLRPISLINKDNMESNALTHEKHLSTCSSQSMQVSPVVQTKKRKLDTSLPAISLEASLYGAICSGPFSKHFLDDSYIEINDELAEFLNADWSLYPQMRFAASRVLAGMLLLNESSGQALVVNTVEVYGRQRSVDSHRECFKESKNKASTSQPRGTLVYGPLPWMIPTERNLSLELKYSTLWLRQVYAWIQTLHLTLAQGHANLL